MVLKRPVTIYFLCIKGHPLYIVFIFADTGYWSNRPYYIISFSVENIKILLKISFQLKTIKYCVPSFLKRFIFTREINIRTTPDDSLYITAILFSLFFIRTILHKQNPWFWPKKVKSKIRTKLALLSYRILERSV